MDTSKIDLFVYTEREGALSAVGHDLKLRATRFDVDRDGDDVRVVVKSDSLQVDACIVDGQEKSVSAGDRKKIERNAAKDVLSAKKHPEIVFEGTITDDTDETFQLKGDLTLAGETNPLTLDFHEEGGRWRGEATLHQPTWGITPYKAMLGALKVKANVRVEVWVDEV
jgi:polyisoprenoid-binding protein YceI